MAANSGSLAALIVYFRRDLSRLAGAWGRSVVGARGGADARLAWWVLAATLPVALAGLAAQDLVARAARSAQLIAVTSILFGLLLGWADLRGRRERGLAALGLGGALAVGLAQVLALLPGSSRSGVTITAALLLGLPREDAARFSFLLAIPVGLLVAVKQVFDLAAGGVDAAGWAVLALGWLVSALSAYLAIGWLLAWVRERTLAVFVVYRVLLGLAIFAL